MAAHNSFSQVLLTGLGIQSRFPRSEGTFLALWSNKKDIIISAYGKKKRCVIQKEEFWE